MARIAFFHNALGKTDGVSLEVDKWRQCLKKMGHEVFYCAGNDDVPGVYCIPELSFFHPETRKILTNATVKLVDYSEPELEKAIYAQRDVIKIKLNRFIKENKIDVFIPNNLLSVGYHLPALIALSEVIEETGYPTIAHNHDFYYESSGEIHPTCALAQRILDTYVLPAFSNVKNLTINRLAQDSLFARKGIRATVVPNVFDFNQPQWTQDSFNSDFRESMSLSKNDIIFLQATRVMNRKGIELAIDVIAQMNKPENIQLLTSKPLYDGRTFSKKDRIVLLCVGHIEEFGSTNDYHQNLLTRAKESGVEIRFVGDRVKHSRGSGPEGKIYSLWDSYAHADFVTYPSLWEGWGNQFIEALFAKQPVILFEYPVFKSDLKADGFKVVSLGSEVSAYNKQGLATIDPSIIKSAAAQAIELLQNADQRKLMVESNYNLARQKYSLEVLEQIISSLL